MCATQVHQQESEVTRRQFSADRLEYIATLPRVDSQENYTNAASIHQASTPHRVREHRARLHADEPRDEHVDGGSPGVSGNRIGLRSPQPANRQ